MLKENFENFIDGASVDEREVATAFAYCDGAVVYRDDSGNLYYLIAELPEIFEIGTVARISGLEPADTADPQLKEKILAAAAKGGKMNHAAN
jgi:hypothetical protein